MGNTRHNMYSAKLKEEYGVWIWEKFRETPTPRLVTLTVAVNDVYKPSDTYIDKRVKSIVLGLGDYNKKSIFFHEYTKAGWPHVHGLVEGEEDILEDVKIENLIKELWYKTTATPAHYEYDRNINGFPTLVREEEGREPLGFIRYEPVQTLLRYCLYISKEGQFIYGRME